MPSWIRIHGAIVLCVLILGTATKLFGQNAHPQERRSLCSPCGSKCRFPEKQR
jgi:hypothetical protein